LSATWPDDDKFHDECGLFGIWNHPEAANVTYLGLYALQHRGQESAGIAATDGDNFHIEKAMGWVADVFSRERLRRLPAAWQIYRVVDALGAAKPKHPVVFECVGVPGVIESIVDSAPLFSRVVVVGVCVGEDRFKPAMAINKEIDLRFVIGYTPLEFRDTLHMLAEGEVDPRPLITGEVGLDGVAAAFTALGDPERHAKILIDPRSATVSV